MPRESEELGTRWDPKSRRWLERRPLTSTTQRSMLYYLVANVGPNGASRPLAIAYRQGRGIGPQRGETRPERATLVVREFTRLMDILCEPANRPAIEAELALAKRYYQNKELDRTQVPDHTQAEIGLTKHIQDGASPPNQYIPDIPWKSGCREFPFISTCLWLSLARNTPLADIHHQPLGTTVADAFEYGIIVVDISEPQHPRYGIFHRTIDYVGEVDAIEWDPVESEDPLEMPVPVIEPLSRRGDTIEGFIRQNWLKGFRGEAGWLRKFKKIKDEALEYIWPESILAQRDTVKDETQEIDGIIEILFQDAARNAPLDQSLLETVVRYPAHQSLIRNHLLKASVFPVEFLNLAFAAAMHLNFAPYALSSGAILQAIASPYLRNSTTLSVCIDKLDDNLAFIKGLRQHTQLREINFLQSPDRPNDEASTHLFTQIRELAPDLLTRNLKFSCAFSAPLTQRFWLLNGPPQLDAYPVQFMFVRKQANNGPSPRFHPYHYYLGDALLSPERIATGFLSYCISGGKDQNLASFASAPPDLRTYANGSGRAISPLPTENFVIPRYVDGQECWPLIRSLTRGSWVLLVSREWCTDRDALSPVDQHLMIGLPQIRYAFVRLRQDLQPGQPFSADKVDVVAGVKEFMAKTAPGNEGQVKKALDVAEKRMATNPWGRLKKGVWYIDPFKEDDAKDMLGMFWEDARFVRGNLREAMRGDPGRGWYPELLDEASEAIARNEVFTDEEFRVTSQYWPGEATWDDR